MIMSYKNKLLYSKYRMSMSEVKYILDKYHLDHKFIVHRNICKTCLNYTNCENVCYKCNLIFIFYFIVIIFFLYTIKNL